MNIPCQMPRLKGFRFARDIIAYAAWAYHRFALSFALWHDYTAELTA
jgi:putative transposase